MLSAQPSGYLFTYLKDESMSAFWKILDNLLHFYTKKNLKSKFEMQRVRILARFALNSFY